MERVWQGWSARHRGYRTTSTHKLNSRVSFLAVKWNTRDFVNVNAACPLLCTILNVNQNDEGLGMRLNLTYLYSLSSHTACVKNVTAAFYILDSTFLSTKSAAQNGLKKLDNVTKFRGRGSWERREWVLSCEASFFYQFKIQSLTLCTSIITCSSCNLIWGDKQ